MAHQKRPTWPVLSGDDRTVLIVGGESARAIAADLDESATVRFASDDEALVRRAEAAGLDTRHVDVTDAGSLGPVAAGVDAAVVAIDSDRTALLTAQLLRVTGGVGTVIVCVTDAAYRDAFRETDIQFVDAPSLLAGAVRDRLADLESGT